MAPHLERRADDCDNGSKVTEHQLDLKPNHAIAETAELAITTRLRCAAARVIAAISPHPPLDSIFSNIGWLRASGAASVANGSSG